MAWFVLVKEPSNGIGNVSYHLHGFTNSPQEANVWEAAGNQVIELAQIPEVSQEPYVARE
jgi:hypothetical protein